MSENSRLSVSEEPQKLSGADASGRPARLPCWNLPGNAGLAEQRAILDALPVLVFLEQAGSIVFANWEARQMLGADAETWTVRPVEDVLWGLYPGTAEPQTLLTATRKGNPFHATMPAASGELIPIEGTYSLIDLERRQAIIVGHPGVRARLPKTRLMEDVLASMPEAVAIEFRNHILYTNPAFAMLLGYGNDEMVGESMSSMIVPETRLSEHAAMLRAVEEHGRAAIETVRVSRSGDLVDVSLLITPLLVDGVKVGIIYSFRDISERIHAENQLQYDAMHDLLTGLPNRALFLDRATQALARRARQPDHSSGFLYIDLDGFQAVNEALGRIGGDGLLMAVAQRLKSCIRAGDTAARLVGDEFVVLVESIAGDADLEGVGRRIQEAVSQAIEVRGHLICCAVTIAAVLSRPDHSTAQEVLQELALTMERAKQKGGSCLESSTARNCIPES